MAIVQVRIQGLMVDPYNQAYIVVLRPDDEGEDTEMLPIWVGKPEANAIGLALEHVETPRPMTHDLLRDVIAVLGAKVLSVVVTDLVENTFFAKVHLLHGEGEVTVDARPSDAIALALRTECPVFVESGVLTRNRTGEIEQWLENLKPEDFGNMD